MFLDNAYGVFFTGRFFTLTLCLTVKAYYVEWHDVFTPEVKACATKTRERLIREAALCAHKIDVSVW